MAIHQPFLPEIWLRVYFSLFFWIRTLLLSMLDFSMVCSFCLLYLLNGIFVYYDSFLEFVTYITVSINRDFKFSGDIRSNNQHDRNWLFCPVVGIISGILNSHGSSLFRDNHFLEPFCHGRACLLWLKCQSTSLDLLIWLQISARRKKRREDEHKLFKEFQNFAHSSGMWMT